MAGLTTVFAQIAEWFGVVIGVITKPGNEILLVSTGIFVFGAVIGLACRLIGRD